MTEYRVTVPYTGSMTYRVLADSPEDALDKAMRLEIIPGSEDDHAELVKENWKRAKAEVCQPCW